MLAAGQEAEVVGLAVAGADPVAAPVGARVMEEAVDLEALLAAVVAHSISPPRSERSLRMC